MTMALLPQADPLDEEALMRLLGDNPQALARQRLQRPRAEQGAVIRKTGVESDSVFDSMPEKALKAVQRFMGGDDPSGEVMGAAGTNLELPGAFEGPIVKGAKLGGKALGDLVSTLKASKAGQYALKNPTIARLRDFYKFGTSLPSTSNWAGQNDELLNALAGDKDKALMYQRLIGATSPQTDVPQNTRQATSALEYFLRNPKTPLSKEAARQLPDAPITLTGAKVPNINRAFEGQPLSGDKVEAFANYQVGKKRAPIDVHTLYMAGSEHDKFDKEIPGLRQFFNDTEGKGALRTGAGGKTDVYTRYENALIDAVEGLDPNRDFNSIFGDMWEGGRAHKGLKPQGSPIDALRKKGLLEYGAMLDPDRLKAALRQQGWTAGAIAGLMTAIGSGRDAPQP
jgi:hypothetical protein